jgi:MFS family permease
VTTAASVSPKAAPAVPVRFLARFTVLKGAVRELWLVFAAKLFAYLAYGVMNYTLVLWLSSDLGYNDRTAGLLVMAWSALMTLFTVFVGSLTDAVGIRKAFLLGISICLASRLIMTLSLARSFVIVAGLLPLAIGEALMGPVMVAGIQRFATTAQRSIAFSMFYAMMNVGLFLSLRIFDLLRRKMGEHGHHAIPGLGSLSTYRMLFLVSFVLTIPNLVLLYWFMREGVDVTDEGVVIRKKVSASRSVGFVRASVSNIRNAGSESVRIFAGLWGQPGFYKFLAFLGFAAVMRLIMIHMYYTYPKFGIRELGEGAPVGSLWAVNNIIIIFLVPIVGALSQRITAYRMVVCGTIIGAASVFIMALPPRLFEPLAAGWPGDLIGHSWLGVKGAVNPYYVMIVLYVVCLSIGEAIYSPRLYEYAAAIAPKGQEASYMALSYLPFFLAKLLVAGISGKLLEMFCPAEGPRHSQTLWLVIALMTSVAPVGLIVFRRFIRVAEAGREE